MVTREEEQHVHNGTRRPLRPPATHNTCLQSGSTAACQSGFNVPPWPHMSPLQWTRARLWHRPARLSQRSQNKHALLLQHGGGTTGQDNKSSPTTTAMTLSSTSSSQTTTNPFCGVFKCLNVTEQMGFSAPVGQRSQLHVYPRPL